MTDRFSELRILRWHDRITRILAGERLGPIRASIDLTNLCQDKCPWCEPIAFRESTIRDGKHTLNTLSALWTIQSLAEMGCQTLNLSGGGEPLLHPDFGNILEYAAKHGLRTWIVTNGFYIDKWMESLLHASHVRVSLDASNQKEHAAMHGKDGDFAKVCENIKTLAAQTKLCTPKRPPEIGISYLVSDCNSSDASLWRLFCLARDLGVDFIHTRPLSEDTPQRFTGNWDQIAEDFLRISRAFPSVRVFPVGKRNRDVFQQRDFTQCYAALTTAVISANGDCCACCDERGKVYGNIHDTPFRELWLSAAHRRMAASISPKLCGRCLMCGVNRSVQNYVVENQALPELI